MPNSPRQLLAAHRRAAALAAAAIVVIAGVVIGVVASQGSPSKPAALSTTTTTAPAPPSTTTTTTIPRLAGNVCPLTDEVAPGGVVPKRPALLVKVGNEPDGARPQSGLNEADIVFDTPAEGFIMRYVVVYQCNNASSIGPTRSLRWVDWEQIARQFVRPIVAFAGGINPNVDGLAATPWIYGANLLEGAAGAGVRISSRVAPDNLYTSTQALYALYKSRTALPRPVFQYTSAGMPGASPAASVGIDFSYGTDPVWKWDPATRQYLHTYSGAPDIDLLSNTQVSTTNIVIEIVHYTLGPYSEHGVGEGDVQSVLTGSGPGYVIRDGAAVKVTWHRQDQLAPTTFTNAAGQPVKLHPGRTWVEIDPDTQADAPGGITITP